MSISNYLQRYSCRARTFRTALRLNNNNDYTRIRARLHSLSIHRTIYQSVSAHGTERTCSLHPRELSHPAPRKRLSLVRVSSSLNHAKLHHCSYANLSANFRLCHPGLHFAPPFARHSFSHTGTCSQLVSVRARFNSTQFPFIFRFREMQSANTAENFACPVQRMNTTHTPGKKTTFACTECNIETLTRCDTEKRRDRANLETHTQKRAPRYYIIIIVICWLHCVCVCMRMMTNRS